MVNRNYFRKDFKYDRNKRIAEAHINDGLSVNEITNNPSYNPEKLTQQRVHQIIKSWRDKSDQT